MITVGLTYDLQDDYLAQGFSKEDAAEFDKPQTIDAIEKAISNNGYFVERIGNLQALVGCLAQGKRWDIVFNICEGVKGIAREAQVPALLEAYNIPFVFSGAETMVITMDKALAKRLVAEVGVPTPKFAVIKDPEEVKRIDLSFPLFVKPLAEGTGKGISRSSYIENREDLIEQCGQMLKQYDQPVLIEEYLPGRDLTVGIVGTGERARVIGVMESFYKEENSKYEGQSFYNKEHWKNVIYYEIAKDKTAEKAAEIALASWVVLGCRDGGRIDLRCDKNNIPCFLEVNPLAGLQPSYSDFPMLAEKMGIEYEDLIGMIMKEACIRSGIVDVSVAVQALYSNEQKRRIVVLYSGEDSADREDEIDTLVQLEEITEELMNLDYEVFSVAFKGSTGKIEGMIRQYKPDVVFNLVESVDRSDRLQYTATALLDRMNIRYTGATTPAVAMLSSKVQTKNILQQSGIPTPGFYANKEEPELVRSFIDGHWIVKSDTEHASVGLDPDSVVNGLDNAVRLINKKEEMHGGRWFAEKYIDGREFNLAMLGRAGKEPQFLPLGEITFKDYPVDAAKIVDYMAKWEKESFNYQSTQRRYDFGQEDNILLDQMKEICLKCWKIFGLSGAVRIDFRVDEKCQPWVIDINANPCLSSDAGFMVAAARKGMTLQDVIKVLLKEELCNVSN
ncbi:MAG: ATP-grasp domain-containing protein [Candidatus Omnitrophica bacterium]|nr:ATP-grasp domain-containing protein [Candidatus Omnitrophota bacterium]MBU1997359.1 ATP-grasp domain-containing protein [Candidatus Omnitrophota bacterium]MBU4333107.1 ATP-grasp domain-containing protein [Candidatus Omnitrophota bacterium]